MPKRVVTQSDPPITDANELRVGMNQRAEWWRRAAKLWIWFLSFAAIIVTALHRWPESYWILCWMVPALAAEAIARRCSRIHRQRVLKADCIYCGYDLAGNESSVCPECGNRVIVLPPGSLKRHPPLK
jgi:hypothetical protein